MSSTYSTNLALELIGTGDQAGTWGNTTNTNLGTLIEQAISGYVTQAVSTGTDTTITIPNGATGVARNMYIELTGTGGASTNLIVPANKKLYFIFNNASGAVTVKVSGQTGVSVPAGKKVVLASNGTDTVNALNYIADFGSNSATITQLTATSATITNLTLTSLVISNLSIASANITTLTSSSATISTTLALSGGTANGVLYLNGSKVATSGSAFVFDGTNVGIGTASPDANFKLDVQAATGRVKLTSTTGTNSVVYQANNTGGTLNVGIDSSTGGSLFGVGAYAAGVWYSGNYPLVFGVNNAEGFRLTSSTLYTASGINVGIGTSSPSKKLDIRANVLGESALVLISNDNTAGTGGSPTVASLEFASSGVAKASIAAAVYGNDWLSFRTGSNTERMRLTTSTLYTDSSINVGIGTSSPATKLDTAGTVRSTTQTVPSSGTGAELYYDATNAGLRGYNRTGSAYVNLALNDNMYVGGGSSGNVGIGTSSPSAKLTINDANGIPIRMGDISSAPASQTAVYVGSSTSALSGGNGDLVLIPRTSDERSILFYTGNGTATLRATLDSSGNLGLGVTPSAWSSGGNITLADNKTIGAAGQYLNLSANWYYSGGEKYVGNGYATLYYQQAGAHKWYIAPNNTSGAGATLAWTTAMTLDASGDLLVGTSSSSGRLTVVTGAGSQAALFQSGSGTTQQTIATFSNVTNSGYLSIAGVGTSSSVGTWTNGSMVIEAVPNSTGNLFIGAYTGDLVFQNGRNNSGRFTSGGDLCVKKTTADATTEGAALQANGRGIFTSNSATECILANRQDSDGTLVDFRQANTTEGSISVSGNTVSYNAFAGSHWSQLQDGSKPDILRGTVMESINELCVWPGENNERLPKSKISDTAGSKKVYGVFMAWDNDWTTTNDMYVTAVGAFICRVNGSVTVQEGDLLESNGDGTARVQADDIIRSSTIGKVTSTVKTHEYDDGSYCVPTVLYCG